MQFSNYLPYAIPLLTLIIIISYCYYQEKLKNKKFEAVFSSLPENTEWKLKNIHYAKDSEDIDRVYYQYQMGNKTFVIRYFLKDLGTESELTVPQTIKPSKEDIKKHLLVDLK